MTSPGTGRFRTGQQQREISRRSALDELCVDLGNHDRSATGGELRLIATCDDGDKLRTRPGVECLPFLGSEHEASHRDVPLHSFTFNVTANAGNFLC